MAADGVSQREIAVRLGINRRTVRRLAAAGEQPRYERATTGSMLDPLEGVIGRLLVEWPAIKAPRVTEILRDGYGYVGSVDLVRKRMAVLRPPQVRAAQRTGYRPGQVLQIDWAEMPTRPKIGGRERRVYALICSLRCWAPSRRSTHCRAVANATRCPAWQALIANALDDELRRIERYGLIVVDEIGYLPLERQAANLLFAFVARRYERGSIIVTSNRGFEAWGEILGDAMVAAALIDRLIHHAHIVTLKGKSYRLRERGTETAPAIHAPPLRGSA